MKRRRSRNPRQFFSDEERSAIEQAIARAESGTSTEFKLVITRHCWGDLREKAVRVFHKLRLDQTVEHNAVLILLVTANRELAVYGDRGIHAHVGEKFWFDVRDEMLDAMRDGQVAEGLCAGIERIGGQLAEFFPYRESDINEIPDDVAYDG
jgi:uncharacterized membrane protein